MNHSLGLTHINKRWQNSTTEEYTINASRLWLSMNYFLAFQSEFTSVSNAYVVRATRVEEQQVE
jgi:hypothetical protein